MPTAWPSPAWPRLRGPSWPHWPPAGSPWPSLSSGLVVWISTVALGMAFRVVAGQGTAVAFVFVALGFLGLTMLGWRVVVLGIRRRRVAAETRRSVTRGVSSPSG